MFLAFSCEEARLKVALLCAAYRTARCKRLVMDGGGIPALRSFARAFLRALDIHNIVHADSRRWGRCVILAGGAQNGASLGFGTLLAP